LPTPQWGVNDFLLRELLVTHLEHCVGIRYKREGTLAERLAYATAKLQSEVPFKVETVKALNHEFIARKRIDPSDPKLPALAVEIEAIDTQIRFAKRPAEIICGIVYRYFRAREDSVGVALALNLKPPAVRQTLKRLHDTWARIASGTAFPCAPPK